MAMSSSGQISIGNIVKEILTGNGSTGTTTPNSTQINLGIGSLTTTTHLTNNSESVLNQYYTAPWNIPTTNDTAPFALSEFYSKRRDGLGGP
tara:strand:+ start:254 stop:529 length:276 start_codon:yes stop_codon:yes gene_type:complete